MGNSGSVALPSGLDRKAELLIGWFQIGDRDDPAQSFEEWGVEVQIADKLQLMAGKDPSYALVKIPLAQFIDERAFTVALQADGPLGNNAIRPRTRGTIFWFNSETRVGVPILCGPVQNVGHDLQFDFGTLAVMDDKSILEKIQMFGRVVYDPRDALEGGRVGFDDPVFIADDPLIFNRFGLQDCLDSAIGGEAVPVFAPEPRFGWKPGDTEEPAPGQAILRARSWRVPDVLRYFQVCYHEDFESVTPIPADYGNNNYVPSFIHWPDGLSEQLSIIDDDGNKIYRPLHNFDCENKNMAVNLQALGEASGPFGLFTKPRGTGTIGGGDADAEGGRSSDSELAFINFSIRRNGTQIYVPGISGAGVIDGGLNVVKGHINESVRNYCDEAILVGDAPVFEETISTALPDNTGNLIAITDQDEAWLQYVYDNYNASILDLIIEEANLLYPLAFIAFRVRAGYDFTEGTKWEGYPINRRHAKILPTLVSSDVPSDENPQNWRPRPIPIEYNNSGWKLLQFQNGLEVSLDGSYFIVPSLRLGTYAGFSSDPTTTAQEELLAITRRDVRVCVAIQADWRITGWANGDPNGAAGRVNSQQFRSSYTHVTKPGDYIEWLRGPGATPLGSSSRLSSANTTLFPDKCTAGNELFSDVPGSVNQPSSGARLPTHAKHRLRDMKRIEASGQIFFDRFDPGMVPGAVIDGVRGSGIDTRGVLKSMTIDAETQSVFGEMG